MSNSNYKFHDSNDVNNTLSKPKWLSLFTENKIDEILSDLINTYVWKIDFIVENNQNFKEVFQKFQNWFNDLINDNFEEVDFKTYFEKIFKNKKEFQDKYPGWKSELINTIFEKLIQKSYSKEQITHNDFKDDLINDFEGEVIFWLFDLKDSTNDPEFKNKFWNILWLNDIFENIFKEEWFRMFASEGDSVYLWFFDNKSTEKKVQILMLYNYILSVFWIEVNAFLDSFTKKESENISIVSANQIWTTVMSNDFNEKAHKINQAHKQWWYNVGVSSDLLKDLPNEIYEDFSNLWFDILNINPNNLYSLSEIKSILNYNNYLNIIFWDDKSEFIKALKSFYLINWNELNINLEHRLIDNKNDLKENISQLELLEIQKDLEIIKIWEESDFVFFFILQDWTIEIKDFAWQKGHSIILNSSDSLIWEMSLFNDTATATVEAKKWTKLVKIPKSDMKMMLWIWWENDVDDIIMDTKYKKIIEKYIKKNIKLKTDYNNWFLAWISNLKEDFGEFEWYKFKTELKLLFPEINSINIYNKKIIETNNKNDSLFLCEAWSEIEIEKNWKIKKIKLFEDTIFWEWSLLNLNNDNYLPNSTIKVISWKIKKISFKDLTDIISNTDNHIVKKIKNLAETRENNNSILI